MAWWDYSDTGKRHRTRETIRNAMKERAQRNRCPACRRANALGRAVHWPGGWAKRCRYCGYEKAGQIR